MRADFFSYNTKYNLSSKQIKGELSERKLKSGVFRIKERKFVCTLGYVLLNILCVASVVVPYPNQTKFLKLIHQKLRVYKTKMFIKLIFGGINK